MHTRKPRSFVRRAWPIPVLMLAMGACSADAREGAIPSAPETNRVSNAKPHPYAIEIALAPVYATGPGADSPVRERLEPVLHSDLER
jgi:hypothetical protein